MDQKLNAESLKELFFYDADTGCLRRVKTTPGIGRKAGSAIGSDNGSGYLVAVVKGDCYKVHRLVWMYHHGEFPEGLCVDHIDGNKKNNRIENLRVVTHQVNLENQRVRRCDNRQGLLGVTWHKATQMWRARITTAGIQRHLGVFSDKDSAHAAYLNAKRSLHAGCTI